MEETGFGVFEDKVVKNYIATEFLYDYLKDKRSVGVIDEDPARAITYVAEPIGVVLALTPITNPTSTVLFKAIVAAKTRNAMIFRPSARAARCAAADRRAAPGGRRGRRPAARHALQVIPDPTLDVVAVPVPPPRRRLHLDHRRPEGGRGRQRRGQAVPERRRGQRAGLHPPQRRRADGRRRHPDLEDLRLVGDLPGRADVHRRRSGLGRDARRARAASAHGCSPTRRWSARAPRPSTTAPSSCRRVGQSCLNLAIDRRLRDGDRRQGAARAAAVATSTSWPRIRSRPRS